jgi:hypothetical protein
MHLIQALFLWLFTAGFAVGGAGVFRRFFPNESPWFGFFVPPLALVILLNFIEHFFALPDLLWLFPVLAGLLIWLGMSPKIAWRELALPAGIFLGSFAFTYLVRCLQPDILPSSDGISDLNKINNFSQGGTLPPLDTWMPPFPYVWYYSLQHYAAVRRGDRRGLQRGARISIRANLHGGRGGGAPVFGRASLGDHRDSIHDRVGGDGQLALHLPVDAPREHVVREQSLRRSDRLR